MEQESAFVQPSFTGILQYLVTWLAVTHISFVFKALEFEIVNKILEILYCHVFFVPICKFLFKSSCAINLIGTITPQTNNTLQPYQLH